MPQKMAMAWQTSHSLSSELNDLSTRPSAWGVGYCLTAGRGCFLLQLVSHDSNDIRMPRRHTSKIPQFESSSNGWNAVVPRLEKNCIAFHLILRSASQYLACMAGTGLHQPCLGPRYSVLAESPLLVSLVPPGRSKRHAASRDTSDLETSRLTQPFVFEELSYIDAWSCHWVLSMG